MRAAIYARFSSDAQRDVSIDIQVEQCQALIASHGWEAVGVYADYAMTGRNDERPEFQRMRADMEAGAFDVLVVYKQDRLARNMALSQGFKASMFALGVRLFSVREGEVVDTPEGFINSSIQDMFAEYYSRNLSVLIKGGIEANAKACKANGQPLYGWDIVDGSYVVNEEERDVLAAMKDMLLAGDGQAEIARAMEAHRTRKGGRFTINAITKLLMRDQNAGTYKYAGHTVENGMPALWSMEEQERVWAVLRTKKQPHKRANTADFLLTGKLRCECGAPMSGVCGTSKSGKRYHYYKCKRCRKQVRREEAERVAVQSVMEALSDEATREWIADMVVAYEAQGGTANQSDAIRAQLRKLEKGRRNVWDALEAGIDPEGARSRLEDITARRVELEAMLDAAERAEAVRIDRDRVLFWLEDIHHAEPEVVISTFVSRMWVRGDSYVVCFSFAGDPPDLPPDYPSGNSVDAAPDAGASTCSPKLPQSPPWEFQANTDLLLYRRGFAFVVAR